MGVESLTWLGIAALVVQSGTFSGLNLALFGVSALRLTVLAKMGDEQAQKVKALRQDSNFVLTTILWGNVGTNVLLTLLPDSVLAGVAGFVFSTFVITFGGEIIPQAYFSRNALRMASLLSPFLRLYQIALYPLAKPSALILDAWLGKESVDYVPEQEIRHTLRHHIRAAESDIGRVEGLGAINFMDLDDLMVEQGQLLDPDSLIDLPFADRGETVDPKSVVRLPVEDGSPVFPAFEASAADPFLRRVQASGKRWVLVGPKDGVPMLALDAPAFLRAAFFASEPPDPLTYCHRPVTVTDPRTRLAQVLVRLEADPSDDVIDRDLILLWSDQKRIITGADLFGYLMRGIARGVA